MESLRQELGALQESNGALERQFEEQSAEKEELKIKMKVKSQVCVCVVLKTPPQHKKIAKREEQKKVQQHEPQNAPNLCNVSDVDFLFVGVC